MFNLTSHKAIGAFIAALKNLPNLQKKLAATTVTGEANGVGITVTCAHAPVAITLPIDFQSMTLEEQATAIYAALADAKQKVDEQVTALAGPLADLLVQKTKSKI